MVLTGIFKNPEGSNTLSYYYILLPVKKSPKSLHKIKCLRHVLDEVSAEEKRLIQQLSKDEFDEDYLLQKISMLQLRLDEAQKTVQAERE